MFTVKAVKKSDCCCYKKYSYILGALEKKAPFNINVTVIMAVKFC